MEPRPQAQGSSEQQKRQWKISISARNKQLAVHCCHSGHLLSRSLAPPFEPFLKGSEGSCPVHEPWGPKDTSYRSPVKHRTAEKLKPLFWPNCRGHWRTLVCSSISKRLHAAPSLPNCYPWMRAESSNGDKVKLLFQRKQESQGVVLDQQQPLRT
jgi:hypothetical protein